MIETLCPHDYLYSTKNVYDETNKSIKEFKGILRSLVARIE